MVILERAKESVKIVSLVGHLDGMTCGEVQEKLTALVEAGTTQMVLDLSRMDYISSAGLRVLLILQKSLKSKSGEAVFLKVQDSVKEVFNLSGFSALFTFFASEEEALNKLQKGV